jgi:hypothetical protein
MAAGMGALAGTLLPSDSDHVDVVHTEICSLHMNALAHTPEQFVVQTLFADGSIAYSVRRQSRWDGGSPALVVNALLEETVPDSADAMVWTCTWKSRDASSGRRPACCGPAGCSSFTLSIETHCTARRDQGRGMVRAQHAGRVGADFCFRFTRSTHIAYIGCAERLQGECDGGTSLGCDGARAVSEAQC